MGIHVFVGAGPANLHRALAIRQYDSEAQFVFIDHRLRTETRDFDRDNSRANIFLLEQEVIDSLLQAGVDQHKLDMTRYVRRYGFEKAPPAHIGRAERAFLSSFPAKIVPGFCVTQ